MAPDREVLRTRLRALGFDVVRFAAVESPAPGSAALVEWIAAGKQADMAWMDRSVPKRIDPLLVLEGAKTMVMLGINYGAEAGAGNGGGTEVGGRPIWARYAQHADYHDTVKEGLAAAGRELEGWGGFGAQDYRYYVDTGPVLERSWAARAGLGFVGKNAMLISREFGNWLFLAAILVRGEIEPDGAISRLAEERPVGTLCGQCTRCLAACPTQALTAPGVVDARRCISYQTIENRGIIPRELRRGIGNRIYGCDICAEVCPWNRFAQTARSGLISARPALKDLELRGLLTLTPERFAAVFKGTAVKRLKLRGLLRNACIVAANVGAMDCVPALGALLTHAEPMVRAHAVWALRMLSPAEAALAIWASQESDPEVRAEGVGEP